MKKFFVVLMSIGILSVFLCSSVGAMTVNGTYFEYDNSGSFIGVFSGNDSEAEIDAAIQDYLGIPFDIQYFAKVENPDSTTTEGDLGFSVTYSASIAEGGDGGLSGTWSSPVLYPLSFYSVMGGGNWALYSQDPAASLGTWNTSDLLAGQSSNFPEISHISGVGVATTAAVPIPATVLLLGTGLLGLVGFRKIIKKN